VPLSPQKKNEADGVFACLIVRCLCLVVELQRKLNIPRGLGARNLSHRGINARVWYVELHVVKRINEVRSELQLKPL
jgi:hypothetical protein